MSHHIDVLSVIVGIVALTLIFASTIPSIIVIAQRLGFPYCKPYADRRSIPEDEDGDPTEKSMSAYSITVQKFVIYIATAVGFFASLAEAVLSTTLQSTFFGWDEDWCQFLAFILLIPHALALSLEKNCIRRFDIAAFAAAASFVKFILTCFFDIRVLTHSHHVHFTVVQTTLWVIQLIATMSLVCAYLCLPRRPDVFIGEKMVDRQYTVSAFSRMTFTWPQHLLDFISKKPTVELEDLPLMDHHTRSETLLGDFQQNAETPKLWKQLFLMHRLTFFKHWTLSIVESFLTFVPQVSMYFILRALERRQAGADIGFDPWLWALALGCGLILLSWGNTWKDWIVESQLELRIQSQLSAAIFDKAIRKSDVRGIESAMIEGDDEEDDDDESVESEMGDGADAQRTYQWTINLIGIDAERVSELCSFAETFLSCFFKFILSLVFLLKLVKWKSLLGALAVFGVLVPMNSLLSKWYSMTQERLMAARDRKTGVISEALQGLRQIKFAALESEWEKKIMRVRISELAEIWRACQYDVGLIFAWDLVPAMMTTVALGIYAIFEGGLTASVAFASLEVFSELEMSLTLVPEALTDLLDGLVSLRRVESYIRSPEKTEYREHSPSVTFRNASVAWPSESNSEEDRFILKNVDLTFPDQKLSVVCGPTGAGKSLLLASILGEADRVSGTVGVPRFSYEMNTISEDVVTPDNWIIATSVAFVAQSPWIENGTLKDNIIFGHPFQPERYRKVIDACALKDDFQILMDGDMTEIGPRGINLSGGQRWRVSLARALYSRAGILILDDIFSAVDVHVGRHIFDNGLTGELGAGRTRILATHHISLCLPKTSYLVLLSDGVMKQAGQPENLENTESFRQLHQALVALEKSDTIRPVTRRRSSVKDAGSQLNTAWDLREEQPDGKALNVFVKPESRVTGNVRWSVYKEYLISSGGAIFWIAVAGVLFFTEALVLGRSWWLKIWTQSPKSESTSLLAHVRVHDARLQNSITPSSDISATAKDNTVWFYLGIYFGISLGMSLVRSFSHLWIWTGSLHASKSLFERMTARILRTPLRWVDTVPVGRVINRFTKDFATFDSSLGNDIAYMFLYILDLVTIVAAAVLVSSYVLLLTIVLSCSCAYFAIRYLVTAREVRRIQSQAQSPIIELFGTTLQGLGTIRAFGKADVYVKKMLRTIDNHTSSHYYILLFNKWMTMRTGMADAVFGVALTFMLVSMKNISPSLVGFALSFMLDGADLARIAIDKYTETELDMNSAERIIEYAQVPIENQHGIDVPAAWPSQGRVEVHKIVATYSPELPAVLKGLSFEAEPNQRVGIVGRTGSGKSSLTLALFRLLELQEGSIYIDGVDISAIRLHDLRSRLSIIPQDPVLFSGSIRSNLDAFNEYSDEELQAALQRVHFPVLETPTPTSLEESDSDSNSNSEESGTVRGGTSYNLSTPISEGGLNLSQGQRQLLCLARAIISRPKVMVLDEATSAVDMHTDSLIQRSIREEFHDSTLLVVAHRLSTVVDFDRILVMSDGEAVEYASPRELVERRGVFWQMVSESGERQELEALLGI